MYAFILRRLFLLVPTLIIISLIVFMLTSVLPGDAALARLGEQQGLDEQAYQALRREMGLDRSLSVRYIDWLADLAQGNFGQSRRAEPIGHLLLMKIPITLQLAIFSTVFAMVLAIPVGIVSAAKPGSFLDQAITFFSLMGIAIPNFWLAVILVYFFSLRFGWLPPSGWSSWSALFSDPLHAVKPLILPTVVLGTSSAAAIVRHLRSALVESLNAAYIRTAYAKGLTKRRVLFGHAMRNALIPVITIVGLQLANIIGGAIVIETIFGIPGLGRTTINAIDARDLPVLQAVVLFGAFIVVIANLIVDLVYAFLDPRIRYS